MKKIIIYLLLITILLTGCTRVEEKNNINKENTSKESDIVSSLNIVINNDNYVLNLESNETVTNLLELLPLEVEMSELNGNEKYIYLDESLPTNSSNPKHINSGDVMLFGDNCLVIFYKSFDTSYSYTKIGHIDNLKDLGSNSITVKITK